MPIEGGAFICYMHEFETFNVQKWDKHCHENKEHTLDVEQQCKKCGSWNRETDWSYPERYVELSHMGPDALEKEIGRREVIVLKCKKCEV